MRVNMSLTQTTERPFLNVSAAYTRANILPVFVRRTFTQNVLTAGVIFAIAGAAFLGNATVITLVASDQQLRSQVSNILITYLALVDMLTALFSMIPSALAVLADKWPFHDVFCELHCFAFYWCSGGTQLTVCLLTVDRFISVWRPLSYQIIVTRLRVFIALIPVALMSCIASFRPVIEHWVVYDYWEIGCNIDWYNYPEVFPWINSMVSIFLVIPGSIIVGANFYIVREARVNQTSKAYVIPMPQPLKPIASQPECKNKQTQAGHSRTLYGNWTTSVPRSDAKMLSSAKERKESVLAFQDSAVKTRLSKATQTVLEYSVADATDTTETCDVFAEGEDEITCESGNHELPNPSAGLSRLDPISTKWWHRFRVALGKDASVKGPSKHAQKVTFWATGRNRIYYSIVIVTVCFFVSVVPYTCTKVIKMITQDIDSVNPGFCLFASLLQYFNSCVNPLVYGILREDFRRAFYRLRMRLFH